MPYAPVAVLIALSWHSSAFFGLRPASHARPGPEVPRAPRVPARGLARACDPGEPDLTELWHAFKGNNTLTVEGAAANLVEHELDPKRRALWEQLRRAAEVEAVKAAKATLSGEDAEDAQDAGEEKPVDWKVRSRALSELQYWLITTGNPDAESALIEQIQEFHDKEQWVALEADGLLRKAWSIHRDASVNARMEEGRAHLRDGNAHAAVETFAAVAKACDPEWAEAHRWHAKVLDKALHDPDRAAEAYDKALVLDPKNYAILFELGALLVTDARAQAMLGGARGLETAERASRGAELLGRAAELNPLLQPKVLQVIGTRDDDDF